MADDEKLRKMLKGKSITNYIALDVAEITGGGNTDVQIRPNTNMIVVCINKGPENVTLIGTDAAGNNEQQNLLTPGGGGTIKSKKKFVATSNKATIVYFAFEE